MTLVFWTEDDKWYKIYVNGHFVCEILAVNTQHAYMKAHHEWAVKRFLKRSGIEDRYMLVCEEIGESTAGTATASESFWINRLASQFVSSPLFSRFGKRRREKGRAGS